ncbi:YfhO family protein [Candidatus Gottesmanbacteria bacterium]|nr:YfhO family protein [Candidatus Gottesmanbacteria bacterium]
MTDWANYKPGRPPEQNGEYNLFSVNPFDNFNTSTPSGQVLSEKSASNYFSATIDTPKDSILLLRATYHPFWQAFIDGKKINTFMVEPAMTAVRVPAGKHLVEFKYYAGLYKQILILVSLLTIPFLFFFLKTKLLKNHLS